MAPAALFESPVHHLHTKGNLVEKNVPPILSTPRPTHLDSALAWKPSAFDLNDPQAQMVHVLSEKEKLDVKAALEHFKGLELDGSEICQSNFPLPTLQVKLRELAQELHSGKGFVILRGMNPRTYNAEDNILVFLGISSYLGELRGKQDHMNNVLMHICDAKNMKVAQEERPARDSNVALTFHTDLWANILALQTLGCAAVGGEHIISPAYTIYNHLAATRPDVLETLMKPDWVFDPHSLHCREVKRPLMYHHNGRIIFNFGRLHVTGEKSSHLSMTPKQAEALQMLQQLAKDYQIKLPLRPGDLCFVNNFAILHSREAFEDSETEIRHLVRLWLKNEALAWDLPPVLEAGNWKVYHDDSTEEHWDILPPPRVNFDVRDKYGP